MAGDLLFCRVNPAFLRKSEMRHFIGIVVFVPLAIIFCVFAVENRVLLTLEIWPFPGSYQLWASVWILGLLASGIVIGLTIGWVSCFGARQRARRAERLNRLLEKQLAERDNSILTVGGRNSLTAPSSNAARAAQNARIEE